MNRFSEAMVEGWSRIGARFLPFADAATEELPLGRLLRLSLFQLSVGMAMALLNGTLNRVMIVEQHVPASLVAFMVALPLVFAPFRALVGFRSDTHRSALGWKRVPFLWFGSLMQFGGLAIMPFALIVLSGDSTAPAFVGHLGAGIAFLLVGAGVHTTQTAGLALATDLATGETRPRVVALLYVMLLVGMVLGSVGFGALLADFSQIRLIKVIQGAATLTLILNVIALWKQEVRDPSRTMGEGPRPSFRESWRAFISGGRSSRLLVTVGLGTAAFSMQDILLEPYGGQILHMSVSATTSLTAFSAGGSIIAFALAAKLLKLSVDPQRIAAVGALIGIFAFAAVVFADPLQSAMVFRIGTFLIGIGSGLFSVCMLIAAMELDSKGQAGLALGAWGAVQASAAGIAVALGGAIRDIVSEAATSGLLGPALTGISTGYGVVYHIEIALLFATLVAIGPLVRTASVAGKRPSSKFGLAEFPS